MTPPEIEQALAQRTAEHRRTLSLAILAGIVGALAAVALAGLSGWFLAGAGLAALAGIGGAFNYLLPSALIRQSAILRTGARYFERLLAHRATLLALADLRADLFASLKQLAPARALALSGGEAAARFVEDVDALENRVVRAPARPSALAAAAASVVLAALAAPAAGLAVAFGLGALAPLAHWLRQRWHAPAVREVQDRLGDLKAAMVAQLEAVAELRVMGLGETSARALAAEAGTLDQARIRAARIDAAIAALVTAAAGLLAGAVLLLGQADIALVAGAALAATAAAEAQGGLVRAAIEDARIRVGLARLAVAAPSQPAPSAPPRALPARPGLVIAAGDERAAIPAGGRLLVAGRSGSGKTRLLLTLAGLSEAHAADVTIGDIALPGVPLAARRSLFALAPQQPTLLAGTIADNLAIARPGLTREAMWQALETACLAATVRARAGGLDGLLGDGGTGLSGGEAKRLSLARALLAGRPWLLLDEPSEGLDAATEAELVTRLESWLRASGTGLVLVSHRRAPHALAGAMLTLDPPGYPSGMMRRMKASNMGTVKAVSPWAGE